MNETPKQEALTADIVDSELLDLKIWHVRNEQPIFWRDYASEKDSEKHKALSDLAQTRINYRAARQEYESWEQSDETAQQKEKEALMAVLRLQVRLKGRGDAGVEEGLQNIHESLDEAIHQWGVQRMILSDTQDRLQIVRDQYMNARFNLLKRIQDFPSYYHLPALSQAVTIKCSRSLGYDDEVGNGRISSE